MLPIKFAVKGMACLVVAGLFSTLSAQQTNPSAAPDPAGQSQPQTNGQSQPAPPTQGSSPDNSSSDKSFDKDKSQQNGSGQNPSTGQTSGSQMSGTAPSGTSNDRLFFTLPNFLTLENAGQVPPLTTRQKYAVVFRGSFDYVLYPWYGFLSGISQAEDSEPGYGQGAEGYGKRYGAAFADGTIENFFTGAILPSLLHQDPRYFQSGNGGFWHRTFYAASRNLITRNDSGKNEFNYSEVVGGALSAAISTYSYHPKGTNPQSPHFIPSDRTLDNTAKVWATQYGYDTLTLVVKEFWPDIRRAIKHKSRRD
jgi:hypothetical protein